MIKTFLGLEFVFVCISIFTEFLNKKNHTLNSKTTLLKRCARKYIRQPTSLSIIYMSFNLK